MTRFSLDGLVLPDPSLYDSTEDWARALVADLQTQLSSALTTISDNDSIGSGEVTSDNLADGSVTNPKVADVAIDTSKLADTAVTTAKIANLSVDTSKLAALAVDASKLADSSVTSTKIANLAVGTAAIANAAVGTAQIANLAVTSALIGNAAIVEAKIADLAVTNAKIANLDANKITTGLLSATRINLDGITLQNNGGTLEVSTIDWTSNIGGSGKPDDNATDGATANDNIAGEIFHEEDFNDNNLTRADALWDATNLDGPDLETSITSVFDGVGTYVYEIGNNSGNDEFWRAIDRKRALPVLAGRTYKVSIRVRRTAGSGNQLYFGVAGWKGDVRNGGGAAVNIVGADSLSSQHYSVSAQEPALNVWTTYEGYWKFDGVAYAANSGTLSDPSVLHQDTQFISPLVLANFSNDSGTYQINEIKLVELDEDQTGSNWSDVRDDDGNKPDDNATANPGALTSVSQFDIELYAATRIGFSSGASAVSLSTSGWKTLDSVDITLPADVTDSIVLVEAVVSIAGNDVGSSTSQGQTLVSARLLDDDNTVVETTSMDFLYIRNLTTAASTRVARGQLTFAFRVPSSALNTSQANTFTFQLNGGVSGYTSITGAALMMRATLHNQSE